MARKERGYILESGMVQTHVHLLARIHPTIPVSLLVKRLKGASSAVAA
jgi:REP element-mobilizing transposase RayT